MNFNIRAKILLAFLLVISVSVVAIVINFFLLNSLNQKTNHIIDVVDQAEIAVFDLRNSFNVDIRAIEAYGNGFAELDETEKIVHVAEAKIDSDIKKIESSDLTHLEHVLSLKNLLATDEIADEKVFELKKSEKNNSTKQMMSSDLHEALISFNQVSDEVSKTIDQVIDDFQQHKTEDVNEFENFINQSRLYISAAFTGSILISLLLAFIISLALSASIRKVRDAALKISQGDLAQRVLVVSRDEVGDLAKAFNQMADKLQQSTVHLEDTVKSRTKELDEERTRLEASINSLNIGFIMTDDKQAILTMNKPARQIFDIQATDTTLDTIQEKLKDRFDIAAYLTKTLTTRAVTEIKEIEHENKFLHIYMAPIILEEDTVIGSIILLEDITEQKMLTRSKDEFFSIASHELRTPLTAIKGNTALIQQYYLDKINDKDFAEMVSDIHESSIRLIEIVNDFLDVSRLEQGRLQFNPEEFEIVPLIENTIKSYQVTGSRNKLYIHFEPSQESISKVFADKDKTRQVIINLIGNGLKFTEEGGITLSIASSGQFVKVLVSDTGRGISSENQKLLFRKFQQAGSSLLTHDTTTGTGLGLYISKLIIEGMGGKINLEKSEEGKGTTFSFLIPVSTQKLKDSHVTKSQTDTTTGLTKIESIPNKK